MPLALGQTLAGRWQIQQLVSDQTYLLYIAVDTKKSLEGRWVVAKAINQTKSPSSEETIALKRNLSRQLTCLSLRHYYLPEPLDYITVDDEPVLVYTYSPGSSLLKHVGDQGPFSPLTALYLVRQIADFLHFLHNEGWLFLGINPTHFVWKEGSFRVVGFGNFLPLDRTTGFATDTVSFYTTQSEQAYLPAESLRQGMFGLGTEYYSLCRLFYFLVTGATLDSMLKRSVSQFQVVDSLPVATEVTETLKYFLSQASQSYSPGRDKSYLERLEQLLPVQKAHDVANELRQKTAAIFADYSGLFGTLRRQIPLSDRQKPRTIFPFDLEGISYLLSRQHPRLHKVVLVSERQRASPEVTSLNRDGWTIVQLGPTTSLFTEVTEFIDQASPRHIALIVREPPQELLKLLDHRGISFSLFPPDTIKASPLTQDEANRKLLEEVGLLRREYSEHKHIAWEFLLQSQDRDKTKQLLRILHSWGTGQSLVTRLARCAHESYPVLVQTAVKSPNLAPTTEKTLRLYYALGRDNFKAISGELNLALELLTRYNHKEISSLFSKYGLAGLRVVAKYGKEAHDALTCFDKAALKVLCSSQASDLLTVMRNRELLDQTKEWYEQYHDLSIISILFMIATRKGQRLPGVTSKQVALIDLAEKQNCLRELMTVLPFIVEEDEDIKTGEKLYDPIKGILIWDSKWTARTKQDVWRIHQALRAGCDDDLDFVCKLATCLCNAERRERGKEWAIRHFVNYDLLKHMLLERDRLIDRTYNRRASQEKIRQVKIEVLDTVRSLVASALPHKIVDVEPGSPVTYQVTTGAKEKSGVVSEFCAGLWSKRGKAVLGAAVEKKRIPSGALMLAPVASFLIRVVEQGNITDKVKLLIPQRYPVGSTVSVQQKNGKYLITDILELPPPITVEYRTRVTFEMLTRDSLTSGYSPRVYFEEGFIEGFKNLVHEAEATWVDQRRSPEARVVEWRQAAGKLQAVVAPSDELSLLAKLRKEKKVGDVVEVKIEKMTRDPDGGGGWISSPTRDGLEIPIEMGDMRISELGYGLERIEGQWVPLIIKSFDVMGRPKLSNLDRITQDLKQIRKIITRTGKKYQIEGYVETTESLGVEQKSIVISCPGDSGVVHCFRAKVPYDCEANITIGQKVFVALSLNEMEGATLYHNLLDFEGTSIPRRLSYSEGKISFPFCLDEKELEYWEAPDDVIQAVYRDSWQFCLEGEVISG